MKNRYRIYIRGKHTGGKVWWCQDNQENKQFSLKTKSKTDIPARDTWIGWDRKARTRNLVYTMDAYVLGALPPYNHILGGKYGRRRFKP